MNLTSSIRVAFEPLRQTAFGAVTANYVIMGAPFNNPVRMLKIYNTTNQDIFISYDGVTNEDYLPAGTGQIYDYGSNKADAAGLFEQPAFRGIYIRHGGAAPTSGSVIAVVIYASQGGQG